MPLQATSGAASQDAYGGNGAAVVPTYIEDVFSTYLYTGTNTNPNTITNGIDLSTKGGMVWCKARSAVNSNTIWDSARGVKNFLITNATNANTNLTSTFPNYGLQSFNSNGFTLGKNYEGENDTGDSIVSWTFRKQPKFFDVVTYTGTGSNTTIAHSLGAVPACIMVKRTDTTGAWQVYHRSLANTEYLVLNTTAAKATGATRWNSTTPTSSVFSLGTDATVNASAGTYIAYIFAHDAGGFGLTGTDNVISCGSYTGTSATGNAQTLGYEPQWILIKNITTAGYDWTVIDTMRGWATNGADAELYADSSSAEYFADNLIDVTATGFNFSVSGATALNTSGNTYIYIACRRGPMAVPTTGTSVFAPVTGSFSSPYTVTTNFPVDLTISGRTAGATMTANDRLRGGTTNFYAYLNTRATDAESTGTGAGLGFQSNTAVIDTNWQTGGDAIWWNWRRAPSFMDICAYTGTGSGGRTVTHNLTVAPEMIIAKNRSGPVNPWLVFTQPTGNSGVLVLNATDALATPYFNWNPTSTTFSVGAQGFASNDSGVNYVAYLFSTCAGVSKVGSYTGTATTKQIDCGFTAGARFVLIKRTDSTGDWYVWDTARGIVAGNDPYILINDSPQVTTTDYIDTYSAGFEISSTAPAAINANGGSFIFLAIS